MQYTRYITDERRRKRILHDLYFTLSALRGGIESTDSTQALSTSSSQLTRPNKTVSQIRNFIAVYLHSARSLRAGIGRLPTVPPVGVLPLDQMRQVGWIACVSCTILH
ncbi:hypothetical protein EON65_50650 [archaeon]|nr:MAG: hypothetical protein EON65_50650 [archaeon]